MNSDLFAHVANAIQNSVKHTDPYCYNYIVDAFPTAIYDDMLKYLPETGRYEQFYHADAVQEGGYSARNRFCITEQNLAQLLPTRAAFWNDLRVVLSSKELQEIVFESLRPDLEKRFGPKLMDAPANADVLLYRDTDGYKITPHTDKITKAVTMGFYLPQNDGHPEYGTSIYQTTGPGQFTEIERLKFVRNAGYCFAVSKNSWHGVEPLNVEDLQRDSLMVIYYLPGAKK